MSGNCIQSQWSNLDVQKALTLSLLPLCGLEAYATPPAVRCRHAHVPFSVARGMRVGRARPDLINRPGHPRIEYSPAARHGRRAAKTRSYILGVRRSDAWLYDAD